jgi:hypothetical protein
MIHFSPEIFGYVAGGLWLLTFYMEEMVPLRLIAILSSISWLVFGCLEHIYPVILVHAILLPLNAIRLRQALLLRPRREGVPAPVRTAPRALF